MQLRKFYGRTVGGAMAQVKRELGADALILETNAIPANHPAAQAVPGARYEILAARDTRPAPRAATPRPESVQNMNPHASPLAAAAATPAPARRNDLLEDLGLLRSQINQLLEGDMEGRAADPARLDLGDYQSLIEQGVDHQVLAPLFRRWLEWRTATPAHRTYMGQLQGGPAVQMRGESLREWLWLAWSERLGMGEMRNAECGMRTEETISDFRFQISDSHSAIRNPQSALEGSAIPKRPRVVGLVGPTGSGKTTTLAKLSSINCHHHRQKSVILTLDTFRFGATEQWRRMGKLMGIEVHEITSAIDVSRSMETWDQYDWIGIDTPGGISRESGPGILYGSILAQYPAMESVIVLPATQQESVSREQMKRYRPLGARKVLFSKLDEAIRNGGIINLTMDGQWKIDSFATGCRIPEDWESASREVLWRRVLAPQIPAGGIAA